MDSLNGRDYTGPPTQMPAGQTHPGVKVPDHRDIEGVASAESNARITAIAGIIVGLIPVLSLVGLVLSIVAFFGYRRLARSPRLPIAGIVISSIVLLGSVVFLLAGGFPSGA